VNVRWLDIGVNVWSLIFLAACTFLIVTRVRALAWKCICLAIEGLALWFLPTMFANLSLVLLVSIIVANERAAGRL
jgi:hypothetical protein